MSDLRPGGAFALPFPFPFPFPLPFIFTWLIDFLGLSATGSTVEALRLWVMQEVEAVEGGGDPALDCHYGWWMPMSRCWLALGGWIGLDGHRGGWMSLDVVVVCIDVDVM